MHPDQLAALEAITDTGTFEAAARRLGVSTSAVSQRIRALESALGRVVVQRGSPSAPTPDGEVVLRYARQQALLAAEMAVELALDDPTEAHAAVGARGPTEIELSVAINADSLATWFPAILREAAEWNCRLRLVVADENNTAELLRSGQVMCAVSSSGTRVAGCRVERLGAVSYSPVIAPGLLTGGVTASSLPVVRFDADDDLQDLALRAAGLPDGDYRFAGGVVTVRDGLPVNEDGTIAGSLLTMNRALRNFHQGTRRPLSELSAMASLNPARLLGLTGKGELAAGMDADIVCLDDDFNVRATFVGGRQVFGA